MSAPATPARPAPEPSPAELAEVLLHVSLTGTMLLRPLFAAGGEELIDFAWERLNPAAQRMLRLPERPAESFLTLFPMAQATGVFGFYRAAFESGQLAHRQNLYQHEGLDGYYVLAAQRCGDLLVVNFNDTNDQSRTAAEQALRASQAREQAIRAELEQQRQTLLEVLAQLPASVATFRGPDYVYELVNPLYQQLFPQRTLRGRSIREAAPELAGQGYLGLFDQVYQTGESYYDYERATVAVYTEGEPPETRYFNFYVQALHDAQGRVSGLLNFAYDVTPQVRARQQLHQLAAELEDRVARRTTEAEAAQAEAEAQRQRLATLIAQAPALIASLTGPRHLVELANAGFRQAFGHRELVGRYYAEAVPELVGQAFIAQLDRVYQTGETYYGHEVLAELERGPAGREQRYYNYIYQATRDLTGQIDGVLIFAYDVTEQVRARRGREDQRQELQRIFEQAPMAVTVLRGPQFTVELANSAMCAIWGREESQLLGRPYFEAVPDTAGQGFEELLATVLRTGEPMFINEAPVTLDRAHTAQPTLGYFNFIFQSLLDDQQQPVGVVAIGLEVTDQVRAREQVERLYQELAAINEELRATNEELHESNTRLSRTNADLDTFVYSASHDLKSPITNIEGLLLALRQQLPPAALQAELVPRLLGMMDEAVRRFQQTLGYLTDVTRLQQAGLDQPAGPVDLPALAEAVRLDILPELTAADATLTLDLAACPTLHFPAKHLRSILYNLLSNAIKYRDPARPARISLRGHPAGSGQVALVVQDNGLGLSGAQQQELFKLFRRLHSHVPGSGVGLYMVKKIVDNAGGTLTVASAPGVGSTFSVTLPAA